MLLISKQPYGKQGILGSGPSGQDKARRAGLGTISPAACGGASFDAPTLLRRLAELCVYRTQASLRAVA